MGTIALESDIRECDPPVDPAGEFVELPEALSIFPPEWIFL
jgi:hypothetical protein